MLDKGTFSWRARGDSDVQNRSLSSGVGRWLVSLGIAEDEQLYQVRRPALKLQPGL